MESYIVRSGDTLGRIADHFGIPLPAILEMNPQIRDPDIVFPGDVINVPQATAGTPSIHSSLVPQSDIPWFEIAKREWETGVKEVAGGDDNPRIVEYHKSTSLRADDDETPWCSSFVNWCMSQAGLRGTNSAAAKSWLDWGGSLDQPRLGCVIVLHRTSNPAFGHVGLYYGETDSAYRVLGGNQFNAVNVKPYAKDRLAGFRWPDQQ